MKKIITTMGLLFSAMAFSQSYVGFLNDNYSGVHAVINNPANIVDSRYRADINLVGVSALAGNDYAGANFSDLLGGKNLNWDLDITKSPSSSNNAIANIDILGPSFMMNILPKHSIAISTRIRSIVNVNDINGEHIDDFEEGFDVNKDFNANLNNPNAIGNAWAEIGLSYATILMDKKEHFLKGGLTLKYLQGLASAKGNGNNVTADYQVNGRTINSITVPSYATTGTVNYGYSASLKNTQNFDGGDIMDYLDTSKGFGTDLGFTYEWRPEVDKYKYSNNEGKQVYYHDVNKYFLKFGLSVTDIGGINYKKGTQETYNIDRTSNEITKEEIDRLENLDLNVDEYLKELFGNPTTSGTTLKTNLPTAIHFSADWNINQKFYLNLDTNFDISNNEKANSIENTYTLTPRYETKWISAYIPLSIYEFSGFNAGFGLRAGPLYVGSGSIITNLLSDKSKGADVYLGLKVPIFQSRPKDKDGDGIFDKVDKCPEEAGPIENNGCPWGDKDGDDVKDNVDKCPESPGEKDNNGCPWADTDKDGITDNIDECPSKAGLKEFNGCPDTDGDGVPDKLDKCPKVKGDKEYKGCPKDADGDGIIDAEDKCPTVAGVAAENGCPEKKIIEVITEEAKKTINSYAKSIYFNSGKTTFRPGVTEKLDMIVGVMNEYPDANFSIEGHTDSQGAKASNQSLSERRAKAVLDYLVQKGISSSRLNSYGFGEEYPIDTNKTRAGRANNRRVEIKLKK